jgi:hypothetical protein
MVPFLFHFEFHCNVYTFFICLRLDLFIFRLGRKGKRRIAVGALRYLMIPKSMTPIINKYNVAWLIEDLLQVRLS